MRTNLRLERKFDMSCKGQKPAMQQKHMWWNACLQTRSLIENLWVDEQSNCVFYLPLIQFFPQMPSQLTFLHLLWPQIFRRHMMDCLAFFPMTEWGQRVYGFCSLFYFMRGNGWKSLHVYNIYKHVISSVTWLMPNQSVICVLGARLSAVEKALYKYWNQFKNTMCWSVKKCV